MLSLTSDFLPHFLEAFGQKGRYDNLMPLDARTSGGKRKRNVKSMQRTPLV